MTIFEEIKNRITVIDYAKRNGLPVNKEGDRTASFIDPGHNKTCVLYSNDFWKDFKTNKGGSVIDLCAYLKYSGSDDIGKAVNDLKNELGIIEDDGNVKNCNSNFKSPKTIEEEVEGWHKTLSKVKEAKSYLTERRINESTVEDLKIGFKNSRIIIPYYKNGKPVYFIGREILNPITDDRPKYKKAPKEYYPDHIPWGFDTLDREAPLIITEGAFDALSFYQEGYKVLSPMCGAFSKDQLKTVIPILKDCETDIILAFDNDKAGKDFTESYANILFRRHIPFNVIEVPESIGDAPIKDISDFYQLTGDLSVLVENSIDDITYFARSLKGKKEEFRKFCYKFARYNPIEDIDYLLTVADKEELFEHDWIKSLKKTVTKTPPQWMVRDEIKEDYELVFNEKFGFYQFNGKIWERKTDTAIKSYIDIKSGKFSKKSYVEGVLGLVKAGCNSDIEFNKKQAITFENGVLELDTGKFRSFNKYDYSTIQLGYEYDTEAKCERFEKYLNDITDSNHEKKKLIQEMVGYCLFPENALHKVFFLIGEGGNGKGVLFKVIESLFGQENITHIEVNGLENDFQRIHLKDSMVNIQPDFKNKKGMFSSPEGWFKSIVAGDTINGCYKQKDFIEFQPRAKWIIGSNEMFKTDDSSGGMARRFIFIDFPVKFVADPKRENEKKIDPFLKDKLLEELPGIFNWAYEGYKRLMENQSFSTTEEQKAMLEEFLSSIDPVIAYVNEFKVGDTGENDFIGNTENYICFTSWCKENNVNVDLTQKAFSQRFAKAFIERNPDWEKGQNEAHDERGLRKRKIQWI